MIEICKRKEGRRKKKEERRNMRVHAIALGVTLTLRCLSATSLLAATVLTAP